MTAARLIDVIAEAMRLKAGWCEADRTALRRWVSGRPPRQGIKERLVRLVADGALRPTAIPAVDEARRQQLVDATAVGLLATAERLETGPTDVWLGGLVGTAAVVLKYLGEHALVLSHGGAAAQAPDWVFSGLAGGRRRNLVAERVAEAVKRAPDADGDGRLRKNAAALLRGSTPHRDTVDEFQVVMSQDARRAGREPPRLTLGLFLHELMDRLEIGLIPRIKILSDIEAIRNGLGVIDEELFVQALEGRVFEAVEHHWCKPGVVGSTDEGAT